MKSRSSQKSFCWITRRMSKYTRSHVIAERRCGLKYVDKAIAMTSRQHIINESIKVANQFPNVWKPGWSNFSWAFGNVVIEIINPKGDISQTWNFDEVLTDEEITDIANKMGYTLPPEKHWSRKKEK